MPSKGNKCCCGGSSSPSHSPSSSPSPEYPTDPCSACRDGIASYSYSVTVAGTVNGTCSDCSTFNTTHYIEAETASGVPLSCEWRNQPPYPTVCGVFALAVNISMFARFGSIAPGKYDLLVTFTSSAFTLNYSSGPLDDPIDCLSSWTLTKTGIQINNGCIAPSTIQVEPAP